MKESKESQLIGNILSDEGIDTDPEPLASIKQRFGAIRSTSAPPVVVDQV
jgi:hypothetical protein